MSSAIFVISVGTELKLLIDELKIEFPKYCIVSASLRSEGSIENIMQNLYDSNIKRIIIVPAFVYEGREYKRACDEVNKFKDKFKVNFITPLVTCYEDFFNIVNIISLNKNDIYCVHKSEIDLHVLMKNEFIWEIGRDCMPVVNDIIRKKISEVNVHPFMLRTGYHVKNDIIELFKPELEKYGIDVNVVEKGLIDYSEIRNIFTDKIKEIEGK